MLKWRRLKAGQENHIDWLSRYLGHERLSETYWYLLATPQFFAATAKEFKYPTDIDGVVNTPERFAYLVQTFFCDYLIKQKDMSPRTISAYRDTFRLLFNFLRSAYGKRSGQLTLGDLDANTSKA